MSFPETLTLADAIPVDHVYTKTNDDATSTNYVDNASTIGLPTTLTISHKIAKPGVSGVDRHVIKHTLIAADSAGALYYLPVTLSINVPRQVITSSDVSNSVAQIKSFLTEARLTQLIRGEL